MKAIQPSVTETLLDAVASGTGNSDVWALPARATQLDWQSSFASAPASITLQLQVSLDNLIWSTIDSSTATAGEDKTINTSAQFVRVRINAISGGSGITVKINAKTGFIGSTDVTTNDLHVLGNLIVDGTSLLTGAVTTGGDLTVGGDIHLKSDGSGVISPGFSIANGADSPVSLLDLIQTDSNPYALRITNLTHDSDVNNAFSIYMSDDGSFNISNPNANEANPSASSVSWSLTNAFDNVAHDPADGGSFTFNMGQGVNSGNDGNFNLTFAGTNGTITINSTPGVSNGSFTKGIRTNTSLLEGPSPFPSVGAIRLGTDDDSGIGWIYGTDFSNSDIPLTGVFGTVNDSAFWGIGHSVPTDNSILLVGRGLAATGTNQTWFGDATHPVFVTSGDHVAIHVPNSFATIGDYDASSDTYILVDPTALSGNGLISLIADKVGSTISLTVGGDFKINNTPGITATGYTKGIRTGAIQYVEGQQTAPQAFVGASHVFDSTNANADVTATSKVAATTVVTIAFVNPGGTVASTTSAAVGSDITVTLACTAGVIVATANDVQAAIAADTNSNNLVSTAVEGTGLGVVDAFAAQTLTGGTDNTIASKGTLIFTDVPEYWVALADIAATDDLTNWRKLSMATVP